MSPVGARKLVAFELPFIDEALLALLDLKVASSGLANPQEPVALCDEHSGYRSSAVDPGAEIYLESASSRDVLGQSLLEALSRSRTIRPEEIDEFFDREKIHERYENSVAGLVQRYNYRSRRSLFAGLKSCFVVCEDGVISISPSRRDGSEGWSGIDREENVVVTEEARPEDIGEATYLALERCNT